MAVDSTKDRETLIKSTIRRRTYRASIGCSTECRPWITTVAHFAKLRVAPFRMKKTQRWASISFRERIKFMTARAKVSDGPKSPRKILSFRNPGRGKSFSCTVSKVRIASEVCDRFNAGRSRSFHISRRMVN